ncbi:MAG TPA: hypothetical protein VFW94_16730, partial [Candidatus Acidoferrales bacterium]|nr:hypothetical protein [Candidatus Acidoferrales bacterium]
EVLKVLADLGVQDRPRLHVLNKIDRLSEEEVAALKQANGHSHSVFASAHTGEGLQDLLRRIDDVMPFDPLVKMRLYVPTSDGRSLSVVHGCGRVLHHQISDGYFVLDAEIPQSLTRRLEEFRREPGAAGAPHRLHA